MVKFTKLPPAKQKARNNFRHTEFLCPECYSTLEYNKDFTKYCTGDRLKLWVPHFRKYEKADLRKKVEILSKFEDTAKFLELYEKWLHKDDKGKRSRFTCDYSTRLFDGHRDNSILIPDPMMLARIEKDLGKKLNIQELHEDTVFYHDGTKYFDKPADKRVSVKLEWVRYPDDV